MSYKQWNDLKSAAVIGSGVMGAAIAAHLANAGIECHLFDIVPQTLTDQERLNGGSLEHPAVRNRLSMQAIERLKKTKPSPLYMEAFAKRIHPGNLEDDLKKLEKVDWIIEAVTERLDIKQQVFARIEPFIKAGTLISSNTSGISLNAIAEGRQDMFKQSFVGIHFFNPPRYMHLVEVIPTSYAKNEAVQHAVQYCERRLGKGVVLAKDTPNFIGNRIATHGIVTVLQEMERTGLSIEEVDAVTGPAMGRPKSATFRTLDLVGLDTFSHVVNNLVDHAPEEERSLFVLPAWYHSLLERGAYGEKSGEGFYKKLGKGKIAALRTDSMNYEERASVQSPTLDAAKRAKGTKEKLKALLQGRDAYGQFAWHILKPSLLYSASQLGIIAEKIEDIDNAMKWGFNWQLGPFETWDAIGVRTSVEKMQQEGETIPSFVLQMLEAGHESFYKQEGSKRFYISNGEYRGIDSVPEHISLKQLKSEGKVIMNNAGASLIDLGDEVACLEFHSPNNAIGEDILSMIVRGAAEVENNYRGLVIANEGRHFCVGANLMLLLAEAQAEEWDEIDEIIRQFQQSMLKLKQLAKPVVAAPHQMTLGGGVEVCLPADVILFSPETYYGLVETGVGLIPAGGGCKEAVLQQSQRFTHREDDLTPPMLRTFETIAMATASTSGHDTERIGYKRSQDRVLNDARRRIFEAKQQVLAMDQAGFRSRYDPLMRVAGREGRAAMWVAIHSMKEAGYISAHDALIASKLAYVLAGGDAPSGALVTEQCMLDLEREAFLSLCGEKKTQQRMEHMLRTGKPLRN